MWTDEYRRELLALLGMWPFNEDEKKFWVRTLTSYAPERVCEALRAQYAEEEVHRKPTMRAIRQRLKEAGQPLGSSLEHVEKRWEELARAGRRFTAPAAGGERTVECKFVDGGLLVGSCGWRLSDRPRYIALGDLSQRGRQEAIHKALLQGGEIRPEERESVLPWAKIPPEELAQMRERGVAVPPGNWSYAGLVAHLARKIGKRVPSEVDDEKRMEEAKRELARRVEEGPPKGQVASPGAGAREEGPSWAPVDAEDCPF